MVDSLIRKAWNNNLIVMWNDGKDRYRRVDRIKGLCAFFQDSFGDHIDLTNVVIEDFLFLKQASPSVVQKEH